MGSDISGSRMSADPPAPIKALLAPLHLLPPDLPRRLRQVADHLEAKQDRIAMSRVAELAAGAGVPPWAVIRFCQILGFSGF